MLSSLPRALNCCTLSCIRACINYLIETFIWSSGKWGPGEKSLIKTLEFDKRLLPHSDKTLFLSYLMNVSGQIMLNATYMHNQMTYLWQGLKITACKCTFIILHFRLFKGEQNLEIQKCSKSTLAMPGVGASPGIWGQSFWGVLRLSSWKAAPGAILLALNSLGTPSLAPDTLCVTGWVADIRNSVTPQESLSKFSFSPSLPSQREGSSQAFSQSTLHISSHSECTPHLLES